MSAAFLADTLLPAIVFVLMTIVGTGIGRADLASVAPNARSVLVCTLAQLTLVPLLAVLLVRLLDPHPAVAVGLIILAVCPSGALSNYYVYLGRGAVSLSVVFTAVSAFVYTAAFPLLAPLALESIGSVHGVATFPRATAGLQLVSFLLIPILLGMGLRQRLGDRMASRRRALDMLAGLLLIATVAISLIVGWPALGPLIGEVIVVAAAFTLAALAAGALAARFVPEFARSACAVECAVRNIPIGILVTKTMVSDVSAVGFAAGYFLVHAPILVGYALLTRRARAKARAGLPDGE